jgi:hypothetical protein
MKSIKAVPVVVAFMFALFLGACGRQCGEGYVAARQLRSTSNNPLTPGNTYEETVCVRVYSTPPPFNPPAFNPPPMRPLVAPRPVIDPANPPRKILGPKPQGPDEKGDEELDK